MSAQPLRALTIHRGRIRFLSKVMNATTVPLNRSLVWKLLIVLKSQGYVPSPITKEVSKRA